MTYYQFLQLESKIMKPQGEMLLPFKKENTGYNSIFLHTHTEEGNQ